MMGVETPYEASLFLWAKQSSADRSAARWLAESSFPLRFSALLRVSALISARLMDCWLSGTSGSLRSYQPSTLNHQPLQAHWVMTRKNLALAVPGVTLKLNVPVPVLVVCSGGGLGRKTGRRSGERLPA